MTILEKVRAELVADAALVALVGQRIYPQLAVQNAASPLVVITVISDVPEVAFDTVPADQLCDARVQIDCYGDTYASAHAVARHVYRVVGALARPDLSATRLGTSDSYDDEAESHRVRSDYAVLTGPD